MNSASAIIYLIISSVMLSVVTGKNKQKTHYAFFLIAFVVSILITKITSNVIALLVLSLSTIYIVKDEMND